MANYGSLEQLTGGLESYLDQTPGVFNSLRSRVNSLAQDPAMTRAYNATIAPELASGGALSPQENRDIEQQTSSAFGARGLEGGNQSMVTDFLNRDAARQQRFNTALGQGQAYQQQKAGLLGQEANLFGQSAGQTSTLSSGIQGLQTGGLNQLLGTESANVGSFTNLTNPLLQYAGNLFQGNQASALQGQIANQNKTAGLEGGAISSIGSILGGVIGLSDKHLKEKIKNLGEKTLGGTPIKSFQFKGDPDKQRFIGVIAQDAMKHEPHAVHRMPSGHLGVNYHSLNMPQFPMAAGSGRSEGRIVARGGDPRGRPIGGIDIPPADMADHTADNTYWGGEPMSLRGNPGTPGWAQGPTMIPTTFDSQGYPYAVPAEGGNSPDQGARYDSLNSGYDPFADFFAFAQTGGSGLVPQQFIRRN